MRGLLPALLLAPALGGLAAVIPPQSSSSVWTELSSQQIALGSSSASSGANILQDTATKTQTSAAAPSPARKIADSGDGVDVGAQPPVQAELNKEFNPADLRNELEELEALREKLPKLEEEITARARWLDHVANKMCSGELTPGSSTCDGGLFCALRKLFGLRGTSRDSLSGRCISGGETKTIPVPPWREKGEKADNDGATWEKVESELYTGTPGDGESALVKLLLSGVLEFGFLVAGLFVVGWCLWLMRKGPKSEGEIEAVMAPLAVAAPRRSPSCSRVFEWMNCCGGRGRTWRERASSDEKMASFGECESQLEEGWTSREEVDERFAVGDEEEEEVFAREVIIEGETARAPVPSWEAPRYPNDDAGDVVVDGFTYNAGVELPDSEASETEVGSESISETGSVSEVDSLEGLTIGDEVASFREAFGLVEDMVAAFEQRGRQT